MTISRLKQFTPDTPIRINPTKLSSALMDIIDKYIISLVDDDKKKTVTIFRKHFKEQINRYNFWYFLASMDFCMYQYTDRMDKNIARICGKDIKRKNGRNGDGKFLCAEHDREHRDSYAKSITLKNGEVYCKGINKDKTNCKYPSRIDGYCTKHYKYIFNISIEKIKEKINKKKYKTYIENIEENYDYVHSFDYISPYICYKDINIKNIKIIEKKEISNNRIYQDIKYICFYNEKNTLMCNNIITQENNNINKVEVDNFHKCSLCNEEAMDLCFDCWDEQQSHYKYIITEVKSDEYVQDLSLIENNINEDISSEPLLFNNKHKNISSKVSETVNDIYKRIYQLNNKIEDNSNLLKNIKKIKIKDKFDKTTLSKYLENGFQIYNDLEHQKEISIYDLNNNKKVNIKKLIEQLQKLTELKKYIDNNKKLLYLNKSNINKSYYYKESDIKNVFESIKLNIDNLYDDFQDYGHNLWKYHINKFESNISDILSDLYNIDDKYKIFI